MDLFSWLLTILGLPVRHRMGWETHHQNDQRIMMMAFNVRYWSRGDLWRRVETTARDGSVILSAPTLSMDLIVSIG
jgi:hypothetical protein